VIALAACGGSERFVRVVPDGITTGAASPPADPTFEVVARVAGVHDPLPVAGAEVAFVDLERALGQAVVRAVAPKHDHVLTVELVAGDARYAEGRLAVSLVARATLRTREGNTFVAQTQVVCRDGATLPARDGARVVWSCMARLAKDLAGWLDGLPPDKEEST